VALAAGGTTPDHACDQQVSPEDPMRFLASVALLAAGLLLGYSTAPLTIDAQGSAFPVQSGESVTMRLESGEYVPCAVIDARDGFIGCKVNGSQEGAEHWYNVRSITRIQKGPR
jgi:hypothetical protein